MGNKTPIPEQVEYYLDLMAYQDDLKVDSLTEEDVKAKLKSIIIMAKFLKRGLGVFDLDESLEAVSKRKYYAFGPDENGSICFYSSTWPKEVGDA